MNRLCLLFMIAGVLLPACAFGTADITCRITAVGADARRDGAGNEIHVYSYRFVPDSRCGDTQVNGSFNVATREAQEKLQRRGGTGTGVWLCNSDPWTTADSNCAKVEVLWAGNAELTQQQIQELEGGGLPISVRPLASIDQDTLRGQLGNALARLPAPVLTVNQDNVLIRRGPGAAEILTGVIDVDPASPPTGGSGAAPGNTDPATTAPNLATGPIVEKGATGLNVEAIQYLLNQSGADVVVDGDFGDQTDAAVRAFQAKKGLAQDGKVGPLTWAALWVTVRTGSGQDDAVRAAQTLLNWHKADLLVDGDFGDITEAAVRKFQTDTKLGVDGVVGTQTWTALVNKP
jgi:peptidoglycan hydrolase-like protein with peptidoglycan-binding domain